MLSAKIRNLDLFVSVTKATKNIRGYALMSMNVETTTTIATNTLSVIIKRVLLHALVISDIKVFFFCFHFAAAVSLLNFIFVNNFEYVVPLK